MNESETRAEHIDPALARAGWGVVAESRIRREFPITPGRIEGANRRGRGLSADYVLEYRGQKLAVVEAKAYYLEVGEGVSQAKDYAHKLQIRHTYASNGRQIYAIDMQARHEGLVAEFPTPDQLWQLVNGQPDFWRDEFAKIPYEDRGGTHGGRYYQDIAVERVLAAVAAGKQRILLTLATGTGKTFIAFQVAWKLFQSRWNLGRTPTRRPRILFLADRNILADQAYNAFSAFPADAMVRITPDSISKYGGIITNGSIFFTIFQTFMTGRDANGHAEPIFGAYQRDFFDVIIIDECHRGGANDESTWRGILEYFAPALQLGLTATPKRNDNADTYAYFGDPVFEYSLKEGINDGFLTPFRVKQYTTSLDDYTVSGNEVIDGDLPVGTVIDADDFNRVVIFPAREEQRVKILLGELNTREKTIIFCANQMHAGMIRDFVNQHAQQQDAFYCVRVTADDGAVGEQYLRDFQDNDRTIPTILTTSHKLSTGVDARNVRNIVLLRPIRSMIEFKQIIGRGTRLFDGKGYFTIHDFVGAHAHFNDPDWDGTVDPTPCHKCGLYPCVCAVSTCPECGQSPCICTREPCPACGKVRCTCERRPKTRIMVPGGTLEVKYTVMTTFWHPDGRQVSVQEFIAMLYGELPELFASEAELRRIWSLPDTRQKLLNGLAERGFGADQLHEIQQILDAEQSDLFDVLAHIAYRYPPQTRDSRAQRALREVGGRYASKQRSFIEFVLAHYVRTGVEELDIPKLATLLTLKYGSLADAMRDLGNPQDVSRVFREFQGYLYVE
jgi:type I restriction enzyme R subunit